MKTKWLFGFIVIWMIFLLLSSKSHMALAEGALVPDLEAVESYLEAEMQRHRLKGMAVAITQGEEIIYLNGFGSAGSERPVTPTMPFFIGSVSKSFTALAVMQLVDQGRIALDAPVQTYLPWFTTADNSLASQITIRHLLNQTSGLSNASLRRPNITEETTVEESIRHLSRAELTAVPGTSFNYFNPNFNILAQVVEVVSGTEFTAYLVENIFAPLEMNQSFIDLESAQRAGVADGHIFFFGFPLPRQQRFYPAELPAGFIISSAEDMAHYTIAQINGGVYQQNEIVSSQAVQAMHTSPPGVPGDYAMGWNLQERDGLRIIRHDGAIETFYAEVILLPDQDIGITLLINQNAFIPIMFSYGPFADGLVNALLGLQPTRAPSLSLIYGILTVIVIYDLVRHGIMLKQMPKWWQKVANKSKFSMTMGVVLSHLLVPSILAFIIIMMITTAGVNAARVTLFYYMFDIVLWLTISVILSVIEAIIKFRWIGQHKPLQKVTEP